MENPAANNSLSGATAAAAAATDGGMHPNLGDEGEQEEKRVLTLLSRSNVSTSDMDPASLRALREHLRGGVVKQSQPSTSSTTAAMGIGGLTTEEEDGKLPARGPVPDETNASPPPLRSRPVVGRGPLGKLSHPLTPSEAEALYVAKQTKEDRILLRLEENTRLLLLLHERVAQLSMAVASSSSSSGIVAGHPPPQWNDNNYAGTVPGRQPPATQQPLPAAAVGERPLPLDASDNHVRPPRQPAAAAAVPVAPPGAAAAGPVAPPNMVVLPLLGSLMQLVGEIPDRLRNSRPAKIFRLYVALRRRQVPDLDMAMLFKVLIMAAILVGRMGRAHSAAPPPKALRFPPDGSMSLTDFLSEVWRRYRFHVASTLIIAGFLVQTGYAKFLYNFVVKEDYPGRIWNGEDLDVEQVLREQQQRQQQRDAPQPPRPGQAPPAAPRAEGAAANVPDGNGPAAQPAAGPVGPAAPEPLGYLVGGRVPRNDDDRAEEAGVAGAGGRRQRRRMPVPIRIVVEIGYLLSSFVLSIFPMWQPVAAEEPPPPPPPHRGEDDNNNNRDNNLGRGNPGQLPRVQPPRDPAEYEDEDEHDYDDDGDDEGEYDSDGE